MTNNLIKRYSVFTHGLLEKQVFSFHLYYFSFYLSFRLVRKLVFLFFNVNVYLMEIPFLNKVTIPKLPNIKGHYLNEVYVNRCLGLSCGLDVVSINNG